MHELRSRTRRTLSILVMWLRGRASWVRVAAGSGNAHARRAEAGRSSSTPPSRVRGLQDEPLPLHRAKNPRVPNPLQYCSPQLSHQRYGSQDGVAYGGTSNGPNRSRSESVCRVSQHDCRRARKADWDPLGVGPGPASTTGPSGLATRLATRRTPCGTWPSGSCISEQPYLQRACYRLVGVSSFGVQPGPRGRAEGIAGSGLNAAITAVASRLARFFPLRHPYPPRTSQEIPQVLALYWITLS